MPNVVSASLVIAFLYSYAFISSSSGQDVTVAIESVGKSVAVIGRLKQPLRTMIPIVGEWRAPAQASKPSTTPAFYVTHVDGLRLERAIMFLTSNLVDPKGVKIAPLVGKSLELNAYEDWGNRNHPKEFIDALNIAPSSPMPRQITCLHGIEVQQRRITK